MPDMKHTIKNKRKHRIVSIQGCLYRTMWINSLGLVVQFIQFDSNASIIRMRQLTEFSPSPEDVVGFYLI